MNSAVSLAMCSNFHKLSSQDSSMNSINMNEHILSQPQMRLVGSLVSSSSESMLPDAAYEGEKIHCFWTTFTLANCWSVAMGSVSSMVFECNGSRVVTPWPINDYTSHSVGIVTVQLFVVVSR